MRKKLTSVFALILCSMLVAACAPEVGSKKWCQNMKEKDKGEWTANEAKDFLKHCVIPDEDQKES